ncbi:MAG TPA: hypothetical protein VJM82_00155 [Nitrospiraceae bacterium]|nr:hypothetical protein [Nitrospiraceae bacterium]
MYTSNSAAPIEHTDQRWLTVIRRIALLLAQAVEGKVGETTRAKLLALRQLEPDEADEVSLALDQAFWKRLFEGDVIRGSPQIADQIFST